MTCFCHCGQSWSSRRPTPFDSGNPYDIERFISKCRKHTDSTELTPTILNDLVRILPFTAIGTSFYPWLGTRTCTDKTTLVN
ncbi:DUF4368 domain-containing protein [Paenibacillus sanguinis]|uniref:DUF4368 domain-containing protein n=1 Tax=Paenibacillus sanguinis TaxID=225906 RepID=UPI000A2F45A9